MLACHVGVANLNDKTVFQTLLDKFTTCFQGVKKIWADRGYQSGDLKLKCLNDDQIDLDIVKRPRARNRVRVIEGHAVDLSKIVDSGFKVFPKRWIVERTFAWINRCRRLSKEYEYLPTTSESRIYLSMIRLMLKRMTTLF